MRSSQRHTSATSRMPLLFRKRGMSEVDEKGDEMPTQDKMHLRLSYSIEGLCGQLDLALPGSVQLGIMNCSTYASIDLVDLRYEDDSWLMVLAPRTSREYELNYLENICTRLGLVPLGRWPRKGLGSMTVQLVKTHCLDHERDPQTDSQIVLSKNTPPDTSLFQATVLVP